MKAAHFPVGLVRAGLTMLTAQSVSGDKTDDLMPQAAVGVLTIFIKTMYKACRHHSVIEFFYHIF